MIKKILTVVFLMLFASSCAVGNDYVRGENQTALHIVTAVGIQVVGTGLVMSYVDAVPASDKQLPDGLDRTFMGAGLFVILASIATQAYLIQHCAEVREEYFDNNERYPRDTFLCDFGY